MSSSTVKEVFVGKLQTDPTQPTCLTHAITDPYSRLVDDPIVPPNARVYLQENSLSDFFTNPYSMLVDDPVISVIATSMETMEISMKNDDKVDRDRSNVSVVKTSPQPSPANNVFLAK